MPPKSIANVLRQRKINHEGIFVGVASLNNQLAVIEADKTTKRELTARPDEK